MIGCLRNPSGNYAQPVWEQLEKVISTICSTKIKTTLKLVWRCMYSLSNLKVKRRLRPLNKQKKLNVSRYFPGAVQAIKFALLCFTNWKTLSGAYRNIIRYERKVFSGSHTYPPYSYVNSWKRCVETKSLGLHNLPAGQRLYRWYCEAAHTHISLSLSTAAFWYSWTCQMKSYGICEQ